VSYLEIPGWSSDILPFYDFIQKRVPQGGLFVEVGVFLGRSLAYMGEIRPDLTWLYAIDPFVELPYMADDPAHRDIIKRWGLHGAFIHMMQTHMPQQVQQRVVVLMGEYQKLTHPLVDLVFIDGDHSFEAAYGDIEHASKLLKPEGVISGHDYAAGVAKAVDQWASEHGKTVVVGTDSPEWSSCWRLES
jgi:predicted O-methyltransferase YrrM